MHFSYLWPTIVLLGSACGSPDGSPEGSATESTTQGSSTATSSISSTGASQSIPSTLCGDDYGPCPPDSEHTHCVHSEGASICGALCAEYGPGFASGRCDLYPYALRSICPYNGEPESAACLILCDEATPCPEEGMVCVACPEAFLDACEAFSGFVMTGPDICAWPDP